jgi:hypothetical protein
MRCPQDLFQVPGVWCFAVSGWRLFHDRGPSVTIWPRLISTSGVSSPGSAVTTARFAALRPSGFHDCGYFTAIFAAKYPQSWHDGQHGEHLPHPGQVKSDIQNTSGVIATVTPNKTGKHSGRARIRGAVDGLCSLCDHFAVRFHPFCGVGKCAKWTGGAPVTGEIRPGRTPSPHLSRTGHTRCLVCAPAASPPGLPGLGQPIQGVPTRPYRPTGVRA